MQATVHDVESLLQASSATPNFQEAVRTLARSNQPSLNLQFNRALPPVKALRTITKLLEEEPGLAIDNATIQASSGCSDFEGTISVNGGDATFEFRWDCAWRADQAGYKDAWGYPDQIRAAREFGYQCFEKWKRVK